MSFSVILYTHNALPPQLERACFDRLNAAVHSCAHTEPAPPDLLVVSSKPFATAPAWRNVIHADNRGPYYDCYSKIVTGCEAVRHGQVFLVEHDVLYPDRYFSWVMPQGRAFWYNRNTWRLSREGWFRCGGQLTSNCCADRALLIEQFRARLALLESGGRIVWDEPGRNPGDVAPMRDRLTIAPCIDVRWGGNLTGDRTAQTYAQVLAGWGNATDWIARLGI